MYGAGNVVEPMAAIIIKIMQIIITRAVAIYGKTRGFDLIPTQCRDNRRDYN